jgi:hypothetical protein
MFATAATLFFVPTVFLLLGKLKKHSETSESSPEPALGSGA